MTKAATIIWNISELQRIIWRKSIYAVQFQIIKIFRYRQKKAWLADRFDEGLVFLKSVERGKCFIEYIPAENA